MNWMGQNTYLKLSVQLAEFFNLWTSECRLQGEIDRPDIKFYPTIHQQVNESLEASLSSSVKRDITATILIGLL